MLLAIFVIIMHVFATALGSRLRARADRINAFESSCELPIEATYVGARVALARDDTVVLSRDPGGTLSLRVEPVTGVA